MCQQYKGMFLVPKSLRSRGVSPVNCRLLPSQLVKFYEKGTLFLKRKLPLFIKKKFVSSSCEKLQTVASEFESSAVASITPINA